MGPTLRLLYAEPGPPVASVDKSAQSAAQGCDATHRSQGAHGSIEVIHLTLTGRIGQEVFDHRMDRAVADVASDRPATTAQCDTVVVDGAGMCCALLQLICIEY